MNEFHSFMFQDIAHLIEAEDSEMTQQQPLSETPLKITHKSSPPTKTLYSINGAKQKTNESVRYRYHASVVQW